MTDEDVLTKYVCVVLGCGPEGVRLKIETRNERTGRKITSSDERVT